MRVLFSFDDLARQGSLSDGVLTLSRDISLEGISTGALPYIVTLLSRYEGAEPPKLTLSLEAMAKTLYSTNEYPVGQPEAYSRRQWRIPGAVQPGVTVRLQIRIPQGTRLLVRAFDVEADGQLPHWQGGPRFNAHLGFHDLAPENTMPAFETAAQNGFPACIVVPKFTKDGVAVCIHDDTINRTGRDENGNVPERDMFVKDMTYAELCRWDFGLFRHPVYRGTRIPLLRDFFALCARTGMRPMFSTHPALTEPQWRQVRGMLEDFGILHLFHIKSFELDTLGTAYSVFGDDIDGYTWDEGKPDIFVQSAVGHAKTRRGIEIRASAMTRDTVLRIRQAGCFASVWACNHCTGEDIRRLMEMGVTEFTTDRHCSMGLNW